MSDTRNDQDIKPMGNRTISKQTSNLTVGLSEVKNDVSNLSTDVSKLISDVESLFAKLSSIESKTGEHADLITELKDIFYS